MTRMRFGCFLAPHHPLGAWDRASDLGVRTFRVRGLAGAPVLPRDIICPMRILPPAILLTVALAVAGCTSSGKPIRPFPSGGSSQTVQATPTVRPTSTPVPTRQPNLTTSPGLEPPLFDAPGSKDFRDVGRYPNSFIQRWGGTAVVNDCGGVGPVPAYVRFEIEYDSSPGAVDQRVEILNYFVDRLTPNGWVVHRSDAFSLMLYRGTDPGPYQYYECNPAGQTEWISIVLPGVKPGLYTVQLVVPQGANPY